MRLILLVHLLLTGWLAAADKPVALVVTGAPGTEEYGQLFAEWGSQWKSAAAQGAMRGTIGLGLRQGHGIISCALFWTAPNVQCR